MGIERRKYVIVQCPLRLAEECLAMADYALSNGLGIPDSVLNTISRLSKYQDDPEADPVPTELLNETHHILCRIIMPATPRSILHLKKEAGSSPILRFFGSMALTRRLALITLVFLLLPLGMLLFHPYLEKLAHLRLFLYLFSAVGLGASLSVLIQVHRAVEKRVFNPLRIGTYWILLARGMVGGFLFAEGVYLIMSRMSGVSQFVAESHPQLASVPIVAMLVGFFMAQICSRLRGEVSGKVVNGANPVQRDLARECNAMASYSLASGLKLPNVVVETIEKLSVKDETSSGSAEGAPVTVASLNHAHQTLSTIIMPAKPRTILLLAEESEKANMLQFLGKVPLVRQLMLASVLFLALFVSLSLSPDVKTDAGGILDSEGLPLLFNLLFLISSAGLGASFAALFQANHYIVNGTFDPKYESSYWIRFFLGIIAGMLLAELIPMGGEGESFGKPTLAMLGGFSAALVYSLLNRMVEMVEAMFAPDQSAIEAAVREMELSMREQIEEIRRNAAKRVTVARGMVLAGEPTEDISEFLNESFDDLYPKDPFGLD